MHACMLQPAGESGREPNCRRATVRDSGLAGCTHCCKPPSQVLSYGNTSLKSDVQVVKLRRKSPGLIERLHIQHNYNFK